MAYHKQVTMIRSLLLLLVLSALSYDGHMVQQQCAFFLMYLGLQVTFLASSYTRGGGGSCSSGVAGGGGERETPLLPSPLPSRSDKGGQGGSGTETPPPL